MRRLLLLRHAKAERSIPGATDRARALIERGRKDAGTMGAYIASHELEIEQVLVSPAVRTLETWKYAGKSFKQAPDTETVEELYDATPQDILAAIQDIDSAFRSVLLIGHNPGLQEAAVTLVASGDLDARERLRENLPTCGLAIIDFPFGDWGRVHARSGRLERFVTPRTLKAAAQ